MKIKSIVLENFKSFKDRQVFDFSKVSGLVFVTGINKDNELLGANGVGKSALFSDAITWVLFGKTTNNVRASNIKNWQSDSYKVSLQIDDFVITRTWNPNGLYLNDQIITQQELENKLNLNFDIFTTAVIISQFGEKFIDLLPSKRLELITNIVLDNRWDNYCEIAKNLAIENETKLKNLSNQKDLICNQMMSYVSDLEKIEYKHKLWQQEEKERKNKIKELEKQLKSLKEPKLKYKQETVDRINSKLDIFKTNYIEIKTKIEDLLKQKNELESIGNVCPTCKQKVNELFKNIVLVDINLKINKYENKKKIVEDKITDLTILLNKIQSEIRKYEIAKKEINEQHKIITSEINILKSFVTKNPYSDLLSEYKQKIINYDSKLHDLDKEINITSKYFNAYNFWSKSFKEIKLLILFSFLKQLEILSNKNLELFGMSDWKVRFDIENESKNKKGLFINIVNDLIDRNVPYECWSGGEMQRIRIAVSFALLELLKIVKKIDCNLIILDEPTQHLSEEGVESLLSFLKDKAKNNTIFYIDHRDIKNLGIFDYTICLVKERYGTRINM